MDGVVIVDKPAGWTSHDVVAKMRGIAKTRRIGHLGTLDPMATGVLPLVLNRATRLAQYFTRAEKAYRATVRFGFATSTYDAEGDPSGPDIVPSFDLAQLESWLDRFRGTFLQTPPPVSAKKIGGTPAYKLARRDIPVTIPPVEVTITRLDVTRFELPEVELYVECAGGTYIRSLAHDLGQIAGCGAHITALVRLRSGAFSIEDARTISDLELLAGRDALAEAVISPRKLLPEFPEEPVDALTATQIRQGRDFRVSPFRVRDSAEFIRVIGPDGELVAIGRALIPNLYHPVLVF